MGDLFRKNTKVNNYSALFMKLVKLKNKKAILWIKVLFKKRANKWMKGIKEFLNFFNKKQIKY